jgi:hypothetical protein
MPSGKHLLPDGGSGGALAAASERALERARDPLAEQHQLASFAPLRALFAQHPEVFTGDLQPRYPGIATWLNGQDPAYVKQLASEALTVFRAVNRRMPKELGPEASSLVCVLGAGLGGILHGLTRSYVASATAAGIAAVTALGAEDPDLREGARAVGRGVTSGLIYLGVRDALRRKAPA